MTAILALLRPVLLPAILAASAGLFGWLWLDGREDHAVEVARLRTDVATLRTNLEAAARNESIAREASREYQAQLSAANTDLDSLRESNRGLQLTARRRIPQVVITAQRLNDPAPQPESYREYEIDTGRLEQLAHNCQADAEQLAALQGWARAQSGQ